MAKYRKQPRGLKFNGFGFPVLLLGAPVKKIRGEKVLDINFNILEELLFLALIRKPGRLSGAELRFIRNHMEMTQQKFSSFLHVDRSSIAKWEKKDLDATEMQTPTEGYLRLKMAQFAKQNLNDQLSEIDPFIRKKTTGRPVEIAVA